MESTASHLQHFKLEKKMNFEDLKNPQAASKAINETLKRFKKKCCMAPEKSGCNGPVISAHTLSKQAMLRPISRDGKVYALDCNFFAPTLDDVVNFKLKGIKDTSVFNGFCSHHDKSLFTEIEDLPFVCSPKQIFTHAFRAVAKETYLKRSQAESSPTVEQIKEMHGISDEEWIENPLFALHAYSSLIGANELERFKQRLDQIYLSEDWSRLVTHVIKFKKMPSVACSAPYSPDYDFEGNSLQDFNNVEIDLETLIVNVFPTADGGFALFSYLDTATSVCQKMVDSIISQPNLTTAIIWFLFGQFENLAIRPEWFESLSGEMKDRLKAHFVHSVDPANFEASRLDLCPEFIDEWEPEQIFKI